MSKGYYCLIQFCPDFARAEAANVGVLVFAPEGPAVGVRVIDDARSVMRRVGGARDPMLNHAVQAMAYQVRNARFESVGELESFVRTRGNQIQLTMPRPMRVEEPVADADRLFEELVSPVRRVPEQVEQAAIDDQLSLAFESLRARLPNRVEVGRTFVIPQLTVRIKSDYSYQNGHLNLVRRLSIPKLDDAVTRHAFQLRGEGEAVKRHLPHEARLIVVATGDGEPRVQGEHIVAKILGDSASAEFVPSSDLDRFVERVKNELIHESE